MTFLWTHFLLKEAFIPVHFLIFVLLLSVTASSLVHINEKSMLYVKGNSVQLIVQGRNRGNLVFHFLHSDTSAMCAWWNFLCIFLYTFFVYFSVNDCFWLHSLPNKHNTPAKRRVSVQYVTLFSFFFSSLRRDFPFRKIYIFVCICYLEISG